MPNSSLKPSCSVCKWATKDTSNFTEPVPKTPFGDPIECQQHNFLVWSPASHVCIYLDAPYKEGGLSTFAENVELEPGSIYAWMGFDHLSEEYSNIPQFQHHELIKLASFQEFSAWTLEKKKDAYQQRNQKEQELLTQSESNEIENKRNALEKLIDWMIEIGQQDINEYVNKLKSQNPGISADDLAKKIVRRKSIKNGLLGAATGLGGILTLPVAVPVDLVASWKIQIFMALAIAHVYGHDEKTADIKTDIYLILAGDSAKEGLKRVGIEVSKGVTKKAVSKYVTRDVMKRIWKVVPQKIITKAGEKSLTSFMKMVPLVGAPVGYTFDWVAAKTVGKTAIKYYSGGG